MILTKNAGQRSDEAVLVHFVAAFQSKPSYSLRVFQDNKHHVQFPSFKTIHRFGVNVLLEALVFRCV